MAFLVVGLGTFGRQVAMALYRGGVEVLAVDIDPAEVEAMKDSVTRAVCCDACDDEAMAAIGAFDLTTAVVAIRGRFDSTVLITHSLRQHGMQRLIVQVDSDKEAEAIRAVGASEVVFPQRDMARRLAKGLLHPDLADQIPLGDDFALVELPCPSTFVGRTLIELGLRHRYGVNLVGVRIPAPTLAGIDQVEINISPTKPLPANARLLLLGSPQQLASLRGEVGG